MRRLTLPAIAAAALFGANPAWASQCSILLDVSASMTGFKSPNSTFPQFLDDLQKVCPDGYIFGDEDPSRGARVQARYPYLDRVDQLSAWPFNNGTTHLGGALETWAADVAQDDGVAIVVTDNVADANDVGITKGGEQDRFSTAITGPEFGHLAVVASRFRFDGKVYDPNNVGTPYHRGRALAIYVVEKSGVAPFASYLQRVTDLAAKYALAYKQIPIHPIIEPAAPRGAFTGVSTQSGSVIAGMEVASDGTLVAHLKNHRLDEAVTINFPIEFSNPRMCGISPPIRRPN